MQTKTKPVPTITVAAGGGGRLRSLDVFRGMTSAAMMLVNNPGSWDAVYGHLNVGAVRGGIFNVPSQVGREILSRGSH